VPKGKLNSYPTVFTGAGQFSTALGVKSIGMGLWYKSIRLKHL